MKNKIDYFREENEMTKKLFNLEYILDFQLLNDIQIIRESDFQYVCYINKKAYGIALTTLGALSVGINKYINKNPSIS